MASINSHDLEIIIINYNGRFWLKKSLDSLKERYLDKTKTKVLVTVVDNNSTDDSVKMLNQEYRWVNLLALSENLGFAGGNNVALRKTRATHVMLLNSDVELTTESNIDTLLDILKAQPDIAVITPKLKLTNGDIDLACHRGEPTLWASLTYFLKLEALWPSSEWFAQYHQLYKDLDTIHEVDACSGAAMIVRTKDMKEVGYLDEQFFMYAEDLDWCKRFREAGKSIIYYPVVSLIHHKNKSGIQSAHGSLADKTRKHFYDTMLQYYDKHYAHRYPKWVRQVVKTVLEIKKGV